MILVIDNGDEGFVVLNHPERLGKTEEELREMGVLLESMPVAEAIEGKVAVLKFDGTQLYYEYEDIPLTIKEQLAIASETIQRQEAMFNLMNEDFAGLLEVLTESGVI